MKRRVFVAPEAFQTIRESVLKTDNNYETGGVLIGYRLAHLYFVVAVTNANTAEKSTKTSFVLDSAEHTQQANEIIARFRKAPAALGIWHSHICDGHNFSRQDKLSNKRFAKTFGGALSMLVTHHNKTVTFSIAHISKTGSHTDCAITVFEK